MNSATHQAVAMSAPTETDKNTSPGAPESPTTARPLEMDDDDVQDSGIVGDDTSKTTPAAASTTAATSDETPPTKPPRPLTEAQKNEAILKEAFPGIDATVIRAVLTASRGQIDPAFNALLEMTDPDAAQREPSEEAPPPQPPRPSGPAHTMSQLESDELYARQLAEQYNAGAYEQRTSSRGQPRQRQQTGLKPNELHDKEHNFFEDDLPVIQERLKQGFVETQGKVNSWITTLKKRIDEEFAESDEPARPQRPGHEQFPGPRPGQASRRSGDYERYDADPQVLSDDFAGMKFSADGTPVRGNRQQVSSPDLFRPPPPSKSPRSSDGRKVAFRDGGDDDVYGVSPKLSAEDSNKPKASKWQPLSTVDPSPITDNDPFSLGDSEDERDAKDKSGSKDIKLDDNERLKLAAAEAMSDSLVDSNKKDETSTAAAGVDAAKKV